MAMKTKSNSRFAFFTPRALIGFALYAASLVLAFGAMRSAAAEDNAAAELSQSVPAQAPSQWKVTGDLVTARYGHTATLLSNGQVLVAGGIGVGGDLASAELYDPASGVWTATGSMATARYCHTATLLSKGLVVVVGGRDDGNVAPGAELYDPATGMWTATAKMGTARYYHTATLLPNGQVLVSGGHSFRLGILAQTQLYTP